MSDERFDSNDPIFERFMRRQFEEAAAAARSSDLLRLHVPPLPPPHLQGLVREGDGEIKEAHEFNVGIWFPPDSRRHVFSRRMYGIRT